MKKAKHEFVITGVEGEFATLEGKTYPLVDTVSVKICSELEEVQWTDNTPIIDWMLRRQWLEVRGIGKRGVSVPVLEPGIATFRGGGYEFRTCEVVITLWSQSLRDETDPPRIYMTDNIEEVLRAYLDSEAAAKSVSVLPLPSPRIGSLMEIELPSWFAGFQERVRNKKVHFTNVKLPSSHDGADEPALVQRTR